jgi:tritrans,polycis-undecaprenyl-diphosphate synthase [geranylgeranyl-diphosphate specific]
MEPTNNKVPKHIGIILDGNRRFARRLMLKPFKGHEWGLEKAETLLEWCKEFDIKELTLYTFSIQNFDRPKQEFDYLMDLFKVNFKKIMEDNRLAENKIRVNFIGRLWMFPKDIQDAMQNLMEKTKKDSEHIVNIAMAYGGREEVLDAVKRIAEKVKAGNLNVNDINEDVFKDNLYLKDDPDLIIRTGGEKRTSNFLVWQSNYSEWIFLDKMWPEFEKEDFAACIQEYSNRQRRFGR